jgi:hypothetical protein
VAGKTPPTGARPVHGDARAAELDRLNARLERLPAQRQALRKAMRQFGADFDLPTWTRAFESTDPDDINRVFAVTGGYLALVNNTAEALKAGVKLTTIRANPGAASTAGIVELIRLDGGVTGDQAGTFIELYRTRNRLQHSSPDVQADEVHTQVRRLLRHLPKLIRAYVSWLARHDVEL